MAKPKIKRVQLHMNVPVSVKDDLRKISAHQISNGNVHMDMTGVVTELIAREKKRLKL